jgi:hypothetical protein
LTATFSTPDIPETTRSMRDEQEAQCIPLTSVRICFIE